RQEELRKLYEWVRPRAVIPMHGEPRHLRAQAKFAASCGIAETLIPRDGHIAKLCPGPVQNVDEAHAGRLHVDGMLIVPAEDGPARQRRKLSFVGAVFVTVVINAKLQLAGDIQMITDGVPQGLKEEMLEAADQAFASMPKPRRQDDAQVIETIRTSIRRAADQVWGKKPITKVGVVRV
ncbi:MAG TPA: MBL fold metallo-hydrolase RNA specificity domain-containing protein, partial [Aestuariivirga sp.]|nr:MBL fold metallo-hydrolase RNA specificity domain-containing protein [Aestuariivirga sp.]